VAAALLEAGRRVVFLARRQPSEPNREMIASVGIIKTIGSAVKTVSTRYLAGSAISQIQTTFDSLHTLRKTVVPRLLADHVAIKVGVIAAKTRNGRFQAGESLLDLAHIVFDATDISADCP
jgi:hypothetical protein